MDKSGAANCAVLDYVLGNTPRESLSGVMLADGRSFLAELGLGKVLYPSRGRQAMPRHAVLGGYSAERVTSYRVGVSRHRL